ncbi:MAG: TIGR04013 family B12-binding domain/radical SAM domain-containing protein [Candidatus Eremiobacteraeota bacterium]|nr:TIGR04013 family B12-binding domain/radical SAM domain-containing protein [Candidatus Eremiobacteraeota bacterium]
MPVVFRRTACNRYSLPVLIGALEKHLAGANVYLLDDHLHLKDFARHFPLTILCYSFMTTQLGTVLREVSFIREHYGSRVLLLGGGPHPTADPEGTLKAGFDAVFTGEAERIFPEAVERVIKEGPGAVQGQSFNDTDIPRLSIDDYFPISETLGLYGPMEISRGCLHHCAFCQTRRIFAPPLRHRSVESVVAGISKAMKGGQKRTFFISPNALSYGSEGKGTVNLAALGGLLSAIKATGTKYIDLAYFPSEVRPEYVSEEALALIKKYCTNRKIAVGIQTGSDSLLRRLRRGHTVAQAVETVALIRSMGLMAHCDFIFGFPGETGDDVKASLELMELITKKFGARIHFHYFLPLPGTPLWGGKPEPLDDRTRSALARFEEDGRLDGWWKEQEKLSMEIQEWKARGYITV